MPGKWRCNGSFWERTKQAENCVSWSTDQQKPPNLAEKGMLSCRFSFKPIHGEISNPKMGSSGMVTTRVVAFEDHAMNENVTGIML